MTHTYVQENQPGVFDPGSAMFGFLLQEKPSGASRAAARLGCPPQNLPIGTVMGRITGSYDLVPLDPAATDGSEVAVAINLRRVDRDTIMSPLVVEALVSDARVYGQALTWPAGAAPAQVAAAVEQLRTVGLIVV